MTLFTLFIFLCRESKSFSTPKIRNRTFIDRKSLKMRSSDNGSRMQTKWKFTDAVWIKSWRTRIKFSSEFDLHPKFAFSLSFSHFFSLFASTMFFDFLRWFIQKRERMKKNKITLDVKVRGVRNFPCSDDSVPLGTIKMSRCKIGK